MNETPKVSIGLPVRNGANFLGATLDSLLSLEFTDFEIVVSDNASHDATPLILADYARKDARIRVCRQDTPLPAIENFNFVLNEARGGLFCWNAHDDLRFKESLSRMVEMMNDPEIACVMTDVVNINEVTGNRRVDNLDAIRIERVREDWSAVRKKFFEVPTTNIFLCFYGLFRRELILRVPLELIRGQSTNLEILFLARVALLGRICSVDCEGFGYRRHPDSLYHREEATETPRRTYRRETSIRIRLIGAVLRSGLGYPEKLGLIWVVLEGWERQIAWFCRRLEAKPRGLILVRQQDLRRGQVGKGGQKFRNLTERMYSLKKWRNWKKWILATPVGRAVRNIYWRSRRRPSLKSAPRVFEEDKSRFVEIIERERVVTERMEKGWRFELPRATRLVFKYRIGTVVDCGANVGQFVEGLRRAGWSGLVHSFEPLSEAFSLLEAKAKSEKNWRVYPLALGEGNGSAKIQVSGNSVSSSILPFSSDFVKLTPEAAPVREEVVAVESLDELVGSGQVAIIEPLMLKLDVQGYELSVLRGAELLLSRVLLLQTELALIPSYQEAPTLEEMKQFLSERGFVLIHLIDGYSDPETLELREVDGVFLNVRLLKESAGRELGNEG